MCIRDSVCTVRLHDNNRLHESMTYTVCHGVKGLIYINKKKYCYSSLSLVTKLTLPDSKIVLVIKIQKLE